MKKFKCTILVLLIISLLILSGCEETGHTTTLQLRFLTDGGRNAQSREPVSPDGQGLAITDYTISGEGPNGKSFDITTSSSQVEINGLSIGTWEIAVAGVNQQGTVLATGNVTHHLTSKDNMVEILLQECVGVGTVSIDFTWEDTLFTGIALDLKLKAQGGDFTTVTTGKTVDPSTASAHYGAQLSNGSYELLYNLYSDGEKLGGGIVAIRILDGMLSSSTIPIVIDKLLPEATGLMIRSDVVAPIVGTIEDIGEVVLPNTAVSARFSRVEGGSSSPMEVDWYLDGEFLGSSNPIGFSTFTGSHRLDVIAKDEVFGSVGSETHAFEASVESLQQVPITVATVTSGDQDANSQPYWLSSVADTAFLRDGNLLIASTEGLQICSIVKDELVVEQSFSDNGLSLEANPYPSAGVTDLVVDTVDDIVCTTARGSGVIVFYSYDPVTVSLQKIAAFEPDQPGGNWWTADITNVVLDPYINRVYFIDYLAGSGEGYFYHAGYDSNSVEAFSLGSLIPTLSSSLVEPERIAINAGGNRLAVACPSIRKVNVYTVNQMHEINYEGHYVDGDVNLGGPYDVRCVGDKVFTFMDDGINVLNRISTSPYFAFAQKATTSEDVVEALVVDSIETNGWAIHGGLDPAVHHMEFVNGTPIYTQGSMDTQSFAASRISLSPKGNFLSISGGNELRLLRIGDG